MDKKNIIDKNFKENFSITESIVNSDENYIMISQFIKNHLESAEGSPAQKLFKNFEEKLINLLKIFYNNEIDLILFKESNENVNPDYIQHFVNLEDYLINIKSIDENYNVEESINENEIKSGIPRDLKEFLKKSIKKIIISIVIDNKQKLFFSFLDHIEYVVYQNDNINKESREKIRKILEHDLKFKREIEKFFFKNIQEIDNLLQNNPNIRKKVKQFNILKTKKMTELKEMPQISPDKITQGLNDKLLLKLEVFDFTDYDMMNQVIYLQQNELGIKAFHSLEKSKPIIFFDSYKTTNKDHFYLYGKINNVNRLSTSGICFIKSKKSINLVDSFKFYDELDRKEKSLYLSTLTVNPYDRPLFVIDIISQIFSKTINLVTSIDENKPLNIIDTNQEEGDDQQNTDAEYKSIFEKITASFHGDSEVKKLFRNNKIETTSIIEIMMIKFLSHIEKFIFSLAKKIRKPYVNLENFISNETDSYVDNLRDLKDELISLSSYFPRIKSEKYNFLFENNSQEFKEFVESREILENQIENIRNPIEMKIEEAIEKDRFIIDYFDNYYKDHKDVMIKKITEAIKNKKNFISILGYQYIEKEKNTIAREGHANCLSIKYDKNELNKIYYILEIAEPHGIVLGYQEKYDDLYKYFSNIFEEINKNLEEDYAEKFVLQKEKSIDILGKNQYFIINLVGPQEQEPLCYMWSLLFGFYRIYFPQESFEEIYYRMSSRSDLMSSGIDVTDTDNNKILGDLSFYEKLAITRKKLTHQQMVDRLVLFTKDLHAINVVYEQRIDSLKNFIIPII